MRNPSPFFSIVVPLHNKTNFIEACVKSVLQQDFQDFELIVIDDGSTDDSLTKIKKFKDKRISVLEQANRGAAAARNRGVKLAQAGWIAFLDADDFWKKNHLAEQFKAIQQFPNEVVFSTRPTIIQENKKEKLARYNFPLKEEIQLLPYFENSIKCNLLVTPGMVIKKAFFEKLGGFNEGIYSGQDTDLFIRIGLQRKIVFSSKNTFSYYVASENNISQTPRFIERLAFINAYQKEADNHPALQKFLDLNRFSIYLRSKMYGDATWKVVDKQLNKSSLTKKQLFLMKFSGNFLKLMKYIQLKLTHFGIEKSAF